MVEQLNWEVQGGGDAVLWRAPLQHVQLTEGFFSFCSQTGWVYSLKVNCVQAWHSDCFRGGCFMAPRCCLSHKQCKCVLRQGKWKVKDVPSSEVQFHAFVWKHRRRVCAHRPAIELRVLYHCGKNNTSGVVSSLILYYFFFWAQNIWCTFLTLSPLNLTCRVINIEIYFLFPQ